METVTAKNTGYMRRAPGVPLHTDDGAVLFHGTIVAEPMQLPRGRRWVIRWPDSGTISRRSWPSRAEASDALVAEYTSRLELHDGFYRARCWCGHLEDTEWVAEISGDPELKELARDCPHRANPHDPLAVFL